ILAEGAADLDVRGCVFRRPTSRPEHGRVAAVRVRTAAREGSPAGRPAPVRIAASHFEGGQVGVFTEGPASLVVRDCTFVASEPAFWCAGGEAREAVAVGLDLG